MKRLLVLACLVAVSPAARADDLTGRTGIGGGLGIGIPTGARWVTDNNKDGIAYGAWLRHHLDKRWGLGLTYDMLDFEGRSRLEPVLVNAYFQLKPDCSWNPNVHAGIGATMTRNIERTGRETTFGLGLGVGIDRFLDKAQEWSIGAAGDFFWNDRIGMNSHYAHAVRVSAKLGWWFGGEAGEPAAPEPAPKRAAAPAPKAAAPKARTTIELAVRFDTDQHEVKPEFDDQLRKVADFMAKHPGSSAEIEGHTDNVGPARYNTDLSQRRADAVRQALIDRFKLDGGRLTAKGYGPERPVADNGTEAGRARNRRVVASFSSLP